ncbi:MAG: ABC transporter permease [Bacteroidales bacterium]|jgi:ABC-2 type transport system permease protein|nr:ABC transporter permease [Bacteroidales bacterium]
MLKFLLEKEFKQTFRSSFLPKIIFIMPTFLLLIMPWAATQEVKDLRITIVDNDNSEFTNRLTRKVVASGYFILASVVRSDKEAMYEIESDKADIMLAYPRDLEKTLVREGNVKVMISANAVNSMNATLGSSYLAGIVNDYAFEITSEFAGGSGAVSVGTAGAASGSGVGASVGAAMQLRFNPNLDYKKFMVPALMVILLTMLAGFLPALNIVTEKEGGTIEQINVTPVSRIAFILGKLIPYWIIGIFVLSLGMLLGYLIYDIIPLRFPGSLLTIYLYSVIYTFVVSGLGLIISNYSNTVQQAMFVIFFFIMLFIIMCGLFTPVKSMPEWAQYIAMFDPLKYFMDVMRAVYLKGSGFMNMLAEFFALCAFAVVFNVWAVISYSKRK